jgi:hypothetical protein
VESPAIFPTLQTVENYETTLARHGQWVRWMRGTVCPCIGTVGSPDPDCNICKGHGKTYRVPGQFRIIRETLKHDGFGRCYPKNAGFDITAVVVMDRFGNSQALAGTQPVDGSYVQLSGSPKRWEKLMIDYTFSPIISIVNENSPVVLPNTLRAIGSTFVDKSKTYEGTLVAVTRVYNVTKDETYTVDRISKEFITLRDMLTWESGDTLGVDYTYIRPFNFVVFNVSQKMRYESGYVLPDADAVMVAPYWADLAPEDVFTMMAGEQIASTVISPAVGSVDTIQNVFDLSTIEHIIDRDGVIYSPPSVQIVERNKIKWLIAKPAVPYTVQYSYHPTFTGMMNFDSLKNAENKRFVNRMNLKSYEKLDSRLI